MLDKGVGGCIEEFTSQFKSTATRHIPNRIVSIRTRDKPGMNSTVRKLFRQARRLHKKAKRTKSPHHIELFIINLHGIPQNKTSFKIQNRI